MPASQLTLAGAAHAKLNLALEVTGRRSDGFHLLDTVFCAVDWHDLVTVTVGTEPGPAEITVSVDGPTADASMADPRALVARAAAAVTRGTGLSIRVTVHKRIPVAAGLGGGSSDAAAVLRLAAELAPRMLPHGPTPSLDDLRAIAGDLGSDVPALLLGGAARGRGRGEQLLALPAPRNCHVAIAVAGASSTAATFAELQEAEWRSDGRAARVEAALRAGEPVADELCGSALEAPARRVSRELDEGMDRLRAVAPGTRWHLTGSGGAAFALAPDVRSAHELADAVRRHGLPARACRTLG